MSAWSAQFFSLSVGNAGVICQTRLVYSDQPVISMILAASDVLSRGRDFEIFFSLCWQWDGWDFNADECALSE